MEVACGEYGDMVPNLVVAVRENICEQFQQLMKVANYEKITAADYETNLLPVSKMNLSSVGYDDTGFEDYMEKETEGSMKETDTVDDNDEKASTWMLQGGDEEKSLKPDTTILQMKPLENNIKATNDDVSTEFFLILGLSCY